MAEKEKKSVGVGLYESAHDVPTGRPTPTQEEHDKIKMGEEVTLAEDGSGPDPHHERSEEARKKMVRRQGAPEKTTAPVTTHKPMATPTPPKQQGG